MTRYTVSDAFPLSGSAGPLLTATVQTMTSPSSLSYLARQAGISKFAASRAAQQLTAVGLLVASPDGYWLNPDHPMTATVIGAAWRYSGVRPEPARPAGDDLFERHPHHLPRSLWAGQPEDAHSPNSGAPDLVTARDICDRLEAAAGRLFAFEQTAQDVYALWSTERLRDMVHQTLHLGGATRAAAAVLKDAAAAQVQGEHDPFQVPVAAGAWVKATYRVSAEVHELLRVLDILDHAITDGGRANRHRANALDALGQVNYAGPQSDLSPRLIAEALEDQRAAEVLDDAGRGRYYSIGGTPCPSDVGGTGDQVYAVQLLRAAHELAAQVDVMAQAACIRDWAGTHPDDAQAHPLVTAVPHDVLSGLWVGTVDTAPRR